MAKPAFLEKLRHGRALCGANFPRFVETFNWLVSSLANLSGDGDRHPEEGGVIVDWEAHDRPVVKLKKSISSGTCFKVVGTDGSEATVGEGTPNHTLTFEPADDTDIRVHVAGSNGNVTATVGVYWK